MNRRDLLKKAVYVAPMILSLRAAPSFAQVGSACHQLDCPVIDPPWPNPPRQNMTPKGRI